MAALLVSKKADPLVAWTDVLKAASMAVRMVALKADLSDVLSVALLVAWLGG
jgi:hypothetical protein